MGPERRAQNVVMLRVFNKIKFKISGLVLVLLIAVTVALYLTTVAIMDRHIQNEVLKRSEALARSVAASAGYSMLAKDFLGLDNMVYKMRESNQDVDFLSIADADGKLIAHSDISMTGKMLSRDAGRVMFQNPDGTVVTEAMDPSAGLFEIASPIVTLNRKLGTAVLGVNRSVLEEAQRSVRARTMAAFAAVFLLGLAGSITLSSLLTRPIRELAKGVDDLKTGEGARRLTIYSFDELGKLTESFNEMTALISDQRDRLSRYAKDLEESSVATVRVLAAAIDARDPYTHGHSVRVSVLSMLLGREIGLDSKELEELEVACLFHDIGKIKMPDAILRKHGKLEPDEYREMMRHIEYGVDLLSKAPSLHKYILPVRHHHEWFNGSGYPDGLHGDAIPLASSIITIADTYDAMTSDRPYRTAYSEGRTFGELERCSGTQFNPELIKVFIKVMEKHIVGRSQNVNA
jgi:HD-GYP domain-containing protein (c-di-GMP phosphodiesterase class II)